MKKLVILSQKGGAGKTTMAVNLAVAADRLGLAAAVIDIDPQISATRWGDSRQAKTPVVISSHAERLPHFLELCQQNEADLVIIDTAPHGEKDALIAARLADFILIPCRPSIVDLRAIESTIDIARLAKKPACVVLNQSPARGSLAQEAAEAVRELGVALASTEIISRVAFIHAFTTGLGVQEYEPDGKAAQEIEALFTHIQTELKENDNVQENQTGRRSAA
jgi:chromosome partitioning protein